ncbi:ABC transporter ATP-binding protein [Levilactobacillus acidifarinae]|uniref:Sugar ABC transporterATPase n=1 Tax=Levilactobacillus acidifarinae DSM 19394 = JCM 15949 TaxID=1423715 RepID=A0A0R1LX88_9LACO|nr:ABC transporter ATP-binding protein [Levilactobacillus acidifarinae]KRK96327.1 sugar ABC transporterATPase [Levilactobacillus acidifarinae DSM 19394]GEO69090.1 ABC transporter ATP-binding protein [Levilactobacillus acidifarinae]
MQVQFTDITLRYAQQTVLDRLNFTVQDGELVALLGPSGSGKTTLLNLLAGLLTPSAGHLLFNGTDVTHQDPRHRHVGMVFQDYALYPHLSVLDNIAFPLKMAHVNRATRYAQAQKYAQLVHVDDQLTKFPRALSGGQQQRVALARTLIKQPALLLLDEPLSNLDAALRLELRDEIRRIQRLTGVTTLLVTHDQDDALRIADRIIVLANGRIQQSGTGAALYRHPQNQFVAQFIGTPPINLIDVAAIRPFIHAEIPPERLQQAATFGIRSEALTFTTTNQPILGQLPITLERQLQIGRDQQTLVHSPIGRLISSQVPLTGTQSPTTLFLQAAGSFLFAADGRCLWDGDADA